MKLSREKPKTRFLLSLALAVASLVLSCRPQQMSDQPRYDPLEPSTFFQDRRSAREPVPGTVARGKLERNSTLYTGKTRGVLAPAFPFPITYEVLERGRERYDIYCSPCHDRLGNGMGMIVRRGFQRPHSFHEDHVREKPPGYYFDIITNGFGAMASYAERVAPRDRWAIVAYIRALQLSQRAPVALLSEDDLRKIERKSR